jgi:glutamine amidotransferase
LQSGELLHVAPDGRAHRRLVLPDPPAHPLRLSDMSARAAASQKPHG